jgi:hypothetical protein
MENSIVEPGIETENSWFVVRSSDQKTTMLVIIWIVEVVTIEGIDIRICWKG